MFALGFLAGVPCTILALAWYATHTARKAKRLRSQVESQSPDVAAYLTWLEESHGWADPS